MRLSKYQRDKLRTLVRNTVTADQRPMLDVFRRLVAAVDRLVDARWPLARMQGLAAEGLARDTAWVGGLVQDVDGTVIQSFTLPMSRRPIPTSGVDPHPQAIGGKAALTIPPGHPIVRLHAEHAAAKDAYNAENSVVRRRYMAFIDAATSVESVLDVWPAAAAVLDAGAEPAEDVAAWVAEHARRAATAETETAAEAAAAAEEK